LEKDSDTMCRENDKARHLTPSSFRGALLGASPE
jgi:hypothetical protein